MLGEKEIITILTTILPKSPSLKKNQDKVSQVFTCDAEMVNIDSSRILVSTDEFSAEDYFTENHPYILGWNVAVGAISDILAAGGKPLYYSHALTIKKTWTEKYISSFAQGLAAVLNRAGVSFVNGDLARADSWRYTATVIGVPGNKDLNRQGAVHGDCIYMTGKIGRGNFSAALKLYAEKLVLLKLAEKLYCKLDLRMKEATLIAEFASSCIDTSDGVFQALNTLSEVNNIGYIISSLPYIKKGLLAAKLLSLPQTLLFLGESGEYELLFTVKAADEMEFLRQAKNQRLTFYRLGTMIQGRDNLKILEEGGKSIILNSLQERARDYNTTEEYVHSLIRWLEKRKI